jgi:hypothetical protein
MAQSGRVRIRVTDATGAVIPQAQVSLLGADGKPQPTLQTDEMGEIIFTDLPIGDSQLIVNHPGFKNLPLTVIVRNGDELGVTAKLEVSDVPTGILLVESPPELPAPLPLSAPKLVASPPPVVDATPVEVAQPPRPKRRWWHIFR